MSDKLQFSKGNHPFILLPVYYTWTLKFWKDNKPPENKGFQDVLENGEVISMAIRRDSISAMWPFNDKTTVVETYRGGQLVDMPFGDVVKRVNQVDTQTINHSCDSDE